MTDELLTITGKFGSFSEYAIQLNRWMLRPIGVWPLSSSTTRIEKIVTQIVIIICWSFSLFTIIFGLLQIILEKEDIYTKLKTVGPLTYWCVGAFNYATLLFHKDDIRYCMDHIRLDWKTISRLKDQEVMFKAAKFGRYVTSVCIGFTFSGVLGFCVVIGTFKQTVKIGNQIVITHSLPCPVYKIPVHTNLMHDIIFTTQFLSAIIICFNVTGTFTFVTTLASHALGQLNVMAIWIDEFVNRISHDDKNIGILVEHHLLTLR